jgi:hypothetical protein
MGLIASNGFGMFVLGIALALGGRSFSIGKKIRFSKNPSPTERDPRPSLFLKDLPLPMVRPASTT